MKHKYSVEFDSVYDLMNVATICDALINRDTGVNNLPEAIWFIVDHIRTDWHNRPDHMIELSDSDAWVSMVRSMKILINLIEKEMPKLLHTTVDLENGRIIPIDWKKEFEVVNLT